MGTPAGSPGLYAATTAGGLILRYGLSTGKSRVIVELIRRRQHRHVLIICPKAVIAAWVGTDGNPGHLRQFWPDAWREYQLLALDQGTARNAALLRAALAVPQRGLIAVTNYEAVWRGELKKLLLGQRWGFVVLDESHRIKAPGSVASTFCRELSKRADHRAILTGTPIAQSPLDIYAQYRYLDPAIFGTSYTMFRHRYTRPLTGWQEYYACAERGEAVTVYNAQGGLQPAAFRDLDDLHRRMYSIAFRVTDAVLDLPEEIDETIYCDLSPQVARAYRQLERDYVAEIKGGHVTAANAAVKGLRLQQVTSDWLPLEDSDGGEWLSGGPDKGAKVKALDDLLDDLPPGEPVVVFCRFRSDLAAIRGLAEKREIKCLELSGSSNDLAAWQSGQGQILAVQIQSGSVGIDLTRARYAVYYSTTWGLADYLQSRRRVNRPGQKRAVTYIHLVARNTIDELMATALARREDVARHVVDRMRDYYVQSNSPPRRVFDHRSRERH